MFLLMKNKKKSLIFSIICGTVIFICTFSVLCPNIKRLQFNFNDNNACSTAVPNNATVITSGTVSPGGEITVTGDPACVLQFPILSDKEIHYLRIDLLSPFAEGTVTRIERTVDGSFTDYTPVSVYAFDGDNCVYIKLEPAAYKAVRIWFNNNCLLNNVSFFDCEPTETLITVNNSVWRYIATAFITVLTFVLTFCIDTKLNLSGSICDCIKNKYLRICIFVIGSGLCVLSGMLAEKVYRVFVGPDSVGNGFNRAGCATFCVIFLSLFIIFFERNNFEKPEKAVFLLLMVAGSYLIVIMPLSHNCWDLDSHYQWAVQASFFKKAFYTESDLFIKNNDLSLFKFAENNISQSISNIIMLNRNDTAVVMSTDTANSLSQVPSGVFIAVARMFGASFYIKYIAGQFANVLVYSSVCYFAVKKIESGKMVLSTIAFFPTNIFIASNYSYDFWVTSFGFLGTAYYINFLRNSNSGKKFKTADIIIMCSAFAIAALPKLIYILLLLLPLFIFRKWNSIYEKRKYYIILTVIFTIVFVMFGIKSVSSSTSVGDVRGGTDVNSLKQVKYILSNPFEYAKTLLLFLKDFFSLKVANMYITNFAYLQKGKLAYLFLSVLVFTSFTDKDKHDAFKGYNFVRIINIIMFFGMSVLIATALYISFTPVGYNTINGCQHRYIIPLIAPLALTIANPGITALKNKKIYNAVIIVILSAALISEIYTVVAVSML